MTWAFARTSAATDAGASRCVPRDHARIEDYLTGEVCPPEGFAQALGYEPQLVRTSYGWRYVKPGSADAQCSGPLPDAGPAWNFGAACATHDYGYDLLRFGFAGRDEVDALFYGDMFAECESSSLVAQPMCRALARAGKTGLDIGRAGLFPVSASKAT
jgi:hypothetical protein